MIHTRLIVPISVLLALCGCKNSSDLTDDNSPSKAQYSLRLGHDLPQDSAQQAAALRFAQLVKERTGGRVEITVHPAQSLGDDHEMIQMARKGQLDIIIPPTAKLSNLAPSMQLVDLPFFFPSSEACYDVLDGATGRALLAQLSKHKLVGAAFWESGFKHFTANRPLTSPADFEGTTFRIMKSVVLRDQFETLGAKTLPISFQKTRQALKDGAVDGQENPLVSIYNMKFYEVQSHLIVSRHGYLAQAVVFSAAVFNSLPQDIQKVLMAAAKEVAPSQRKDAQTREKRFLEEIRKSGTKIIDLTLKEREAFRVASWPVVEKHRIRIGTALVERALQQIENNRTYDDDQLVVGIDADMAGNSALSGLAIRRGAELAIREINDGGGILGKRLALAVRDNSMVPARGLDNLKRFSRMPQLVAVLGGISSPVALAELDLIHEKQILYLDPWAAATPIVENGRSPNFVFRVSVRDQHAAGFLIPEALSVSNDVALLLVNNGWGRSNHKAMVKELAERGLKPALVQWFDWGDGQVSREVDAIYNSGAKVIVYVGNGVEAAKFVKAIAKRKQPMTIVSHWGITGGEFPKWAGKALKAVDLRVLQTFSFIGNESEKAKAISVEYKRRYGVTDLREIPAPVGTAHAYDLVHLLAHAIRKADSTAPLKIRAALEQLGEYEGLVKTYDPPFTPTMHDAIDQASFFFAKYDGLALVPYR